MIEKKAFRFFNPLNDLVLAVFQGDGITGREFERVLHQIAQANFGAGNISENRDDRVFFQGQTANAGDVVQPAGFS